jgi:hypothetical protein
LRRGRELFALSAVLLGAATLVVVQVVQAQEGPGRRPRALEIGPGEECPPGTTEARPGRCMWPEFPAPSILDYRPRSTLVVKETPVPKARHPFVDIHSHVGPTPDTI